MSVIVQLNNKIENRNCKNNKRNIGLIIVMKKKIRNGQNRL